MTASPQIVVQNGPNLIPWLSFGSSAILALITLWYVILTARILRQSQAVEAARQREQVASQASQVAAWVSSSAVEDPQVTVETTLLNPTSQAVYDVKVTVVDMSGGALALAPHSVAVLGPGQRLTHTGRCSLPPNAGGSLRASLAFVDGQGKKWVRDHNGSLTPSD